MGDEFSFDGRSVPVRPGQTIAGALWSNGVRSWRTTRVQGAPRGLFCGIGACFDCLATIDGVPGQRTCIAPARPGSVVSSQAAPIMPAPRAAAATPAAGPPTAIGAPPDYEVAPVPAGYDVIVVGAGPAGLAAAATAALGGVRVALLDSAGRPGGQFWRHREGETRDLRDQSVFAGLTSIVEERVDYVPGATVWFAEPGFTLHTTAGRFSAPRVVLATGAYDRVMPFPGWDLPGVVTPGGAQALLKGSGVAVGREVVVAGAGPFLLPVAVGLAAAGVRVVGVYEAGDPRRYVRRPSALTAVAGKMGEAAGYLAALARYRVPYRLRHAVVTAHGSDRPGTAGVSRASRLSSVDVARLDEHGQLVPGSVRRVGCDAVAVGYGFTANLELALALGCVTRRSPDGGLAVMVDVQGETSVEGVYAAGEITGVGGATLAVVEGQLAGAAAAQPVALRSGGPLSGRDIASLRRRRQRLRAFADTMAAAHAVPAGWTAWLNGRTLVCRCEEVSHAAVAAAVTELGATDARTVKLLTRTGMGWCQGRECGYATAELTARLCGRQITREDLLAFAHRPLATPITLGDLATD
jgi:NADPH-dependent 2,4-dienoyl-CoA reductase/sulfur reductase-like enzyme